jgi:hypothetical protein
MTRSRCRKPGLWRLPRFGDDWTERAENDSSLHQPGSFVAHGKPVARISCTPPQATAMCAAFIEESRIKFINNSKLHRKIRGTRISCTRPQATPACAAFIEESRIKFINDNKLHRKFGELWTSCEAFQGGARGMRMSPRARGGRGRPWAMISV